MGLIQVQVVLHQNRWREVMLVEGAVEVELRCEAVDVKRSDMEHVEQNAHQDM